MCVSEHIKIFTGMDILVKYAPLIAGTIKAIDVAHTLNDNHALCMTSLLAVTHCGDHDSDDNDYAQGTLLIKILLDQQNIKGVALLFGVILRDYKDLAINIPELSCGERFSIYLGDDLFLRVIVDDGEPLVDFRYMEVS